MERLVKVGKIQPKNSKDVKHSKIGLGFEKLDRDVLILKRLMIRLPKQVSNGQEYSQASREQNVKRAFIILNGLTV